MFSSEVGTAEAGTYTAAKPASGKAGRRRALAGLVALVSAVFGGAAAADLASASTPTTTYNFAEALSPQPESGSNWGTRAASTGDFDGDAKNDVWIATPSQDVTSNGTTYTDAGKVRLVSGASLAAGGNPTTIRTIESPELQNAAKFGFAISVIGNVTGDGQDDIAIGTDAQDTSATDSGKAWVFDGATGTKAYDLNNPTAEGSARFGSRISRAGDIVKADGTAGTDTKSEIIVGASNADPPGVSTATNRGRAYILNGHNGALVRTLDLPDVVSCSSTVRNPCGSGNFGLTVQGPGDVDGDGKPDQLVAAPSLTVGTNTEQGRMFVFSGATGGLIRRVDDPTPQKKAYFGFQDAAPLSPGDVNSDGYADIYANGFYQHRTVGSTTYPEAGRAWVFSGAPPSSGTNAPQLYEVLDPTPTKGGQFGWSLAKTDYDLDGKPDLYVGSSPHHYSDNTTIDQRGGTYVFKGLDGTVLKRLDETVATSLQISGGNLGSNLGWTVTAPGDLTGDGNPDYVAGAPFHDGTNTDQGSVFTFKSAP